MNPKDTKECRVPPQWENLQGGWWIGANGYREDEHSVGSYHQRGRVSGRREISPEIGRPSLEHANRDPRRVFGALPNSSYISGSQGHAIARNSGPRSAALPLSTVRAVEQPGRVSSEDREGDYSPTNRCVRDRGDAYWEEECSHLRRQLAILTREFEKSECQKHRMLQEDVANCSRQITELRRAIEAQTQLVLETLVAAQRVISRKAVDPPESCVQSPGVLPDSGKTPAPTSGGISTVLPEPATYYPAVLSVYGHQQQQQHLHHHCLRLEELGSIISAHRDEQRRTPDSPRQPKRNVEHAASRIRGHSSRASLTEHRETLLSGAEDPGSVASPAGGISSTCSSQCNGRGTRQSTKSEGMHRAEILYDAAMLATKSSGTAVDRQALDATGPASNAVRPAAQEDAPGWYRRLTSGLDSTCNRAPKSDWKRLAGGGRMRCGRESELWEWDDRKVMFEPSQTTPRRATLRTEGVSEEEYGSRESSRRESKRRTKTTQSFCSNVKPRSGSKGHPTEGEKEMPSTRRLEEGGNMINNELQEASKDESIASPTLNPKPSSNNLACGATTVVYESPGKNIRMTQMGSKESHQEDPPALVAEQAEPLEHAKASTSCLEPYSPQFPQAEQVKGTTSKAEPKTTETIGATVVQSTIPKTPITERDDEEDEKTTYTAVVVEL